MSFYDTTFRSIFTMIKARYYGGSFLIFLSLNACCAVRSRSSCQQADTPCDGCITLMWRQKELQCEPDAMYYYVLLLLLCITVMTMYYYVSLCITMYHYVILSGDRKSFEGSQMSCVAYVRAGRAYVCVRASGCAARRCTFLWK